MKTTRAVAAAAVLVAPMLLSGCRDAANRSASADVVPLALPLRTQAGSVSMFPSPGSRAAAPKTQISLRAVAPIDTDGFVVTGSRTGVHAGAFRAHSDGGGTSFVPATPFAAGETVTVTSRLPIRGSHDGRSTFVVATPAVETTPPPRQTPPGPTPPPPTTSSFPSATTLQPPTVTVTATATHFPSYDVLLSTKGNGLPSALMIVDRRGGLVWYRPMPKGTAVNDLKVQQWDGRPVLSYWQGTQNLSHGYGNGVDVVVDAHYRQVATVDAGNGYQADLHDFVLDRDGSALVIAYAPVRWDLRPVGGRSDGIVIDGVVQRIDLATGLVEFEWHSLDHVPLSASSVKPTHDATTAWDFVHVNSVGPDGDALLVSGRHTSAIYEVDQATGDTVWTLGGKGSDFAVPAQARFGFQHDARRVGAGLISLFDDGGGPPRTESQSRGLVLRVDTDRHTVAVVRSDVHAPPIAADSQGNVSLLPDGGVLVGWGSEPNLTEYDDAGHVVWDAHLPDGVSSYRAFASPWTGAPVTVPDIVVSIVTGRQVVRMSWNGDTRTSVWRVTATARGATRTFTARRSGFETTLRLPAGFVFTAVRAVDDGGHVLTRLP
jgi:hypothetical protein